MHPPILYKQLTDGHHQPILHSWCNIFAHKTSAFRNSSSVKMLFSRNAAYNSRTFQIVTTALNF